MEDEYDPLSIRSAVAVVQAHNKFTGNSNDGKSGMQEGGLEFDGGQPLESVHEFDGAMSLESGHESDGSGSQESRHGSDGENASFHDQERADQDKAMSEEQEGGR